MKFQNSKTKKCNTESIWSRHHWSFTNIKSN